jgi:ribosome biogenesis GTPase / thiamine phosphate phosphatase
MARKKGKSSHRIRDWQQELRSGTKSERTAGRSRHTQRAVKLPSYRLEFPELNLEMLPKVEGMVVGFFPGGVIVRAGGQDMICGIAKTFRAPEGLSALAVGDIVTAALTCAEHANAAEADKVRADGLILSRQARQSALVRPAPRSGKRTDKYETETTEKVIVANMDMLMIVTSVAQPAFRAAVVDRFLIIAERSELQPVLVVNKMDLDPLDEEKLADFVQLGLKIVRCSAVTGKGLDNLRAVLSGRKSVLAGASGVGKSALVNALVPSAKAATRPIRMRDQRGRHTTAATVIYELPAPGGEGTPAGIIVDTPGVRELGINLTAAELPWYFPEFQQYSQGCKFNNCTHTHEPDCAVQSAVEDGLIQPRRYESYLRILETLEK